MFICLVKPHTPGREDDGEAVGFIRNVLLALALIITPLMSDLSPAAGKS